MMTPIPADVLQAVTSAVESLKPEEVRALIDGQGRLVFVRNKLRKQKPERPPIDVAELAQEFERCRTRDEGYLLLQERVRNKAHLLALANHFAIAVYSNTRCDEIQKRLVAGVIGRRLAREAIFSLTLH